ncbi:Scramblase [Oesophagostomum dentatum]|uniref:Phospholipid scramblase n=1 Tax=Oesophagostomum dentatum TaxID=61180 RepID=A0A0B1T1Y0_OESDE|nr:Scramblase [Oesophagostomum dentatum]
MFPMQPVQGSFTTSTITAQPGVVLGQTAIWMPLPQPIEGVPPGLEYLTMVDKIMVHQIYEVMELITGFETKNKYVLRNANGEQEVLLIRRPFKCCGGGCCGLFANFGCCATECIVESPPGNVVVTPSGQEIGSITKKWGGWLREAYTDADIFSVTFPIDLDVHAKAILLAATFLVDFMEFEQTANRNSD